MRLNARSHVKPMLDYILDYMIIDLVTTILELPSFLAWAPINK